MIQHLNELPSIGSYNCTATAYTTDSFPVNLNHQWVGNVNTAEIDEQFRHFQKARQLPTPDPVPFMAKRIVRVYLADTDENVPLDKSLLYKSDEKLTDLNDQELYFEIPVKELLDKHNAVRVGIVDKKATQKIGKEVFLEPVKIRDLKMTVVNIATF
jgi:hypothetical protein